MDTTTNAATSRASDFVTACIDAHVHEHMPPAPAALWNAGTQLLGKTDSTDTRIGFALMLDALFQSPDALAHVAAELRAMLVDTAPGLEALKPKRTPAE
jgi:hypothetical protein